MRTSGGILAQGVTPTPTYDINIPTSADLDASLATAIAENVPTAVVRVIHPKISKSTGEDTSVSAQVSQSSNFKVAVAYATAEAAYSSWIPHLWDDRINRLTPNYKEYLETNPERAIYLLEIDRVIHLPDGIHIGLVLEERDTGSHCSSPNYWGGRCPTLPNHNLGNKDGSHVWVDSSGNVYVLDSHTLRDGFSFLSEFKIRRYSR